MKLNLLLLLILLISCSKNKSEYQFEFVNPEEKAFSSTKLDSLSSFLAKKGSSSMIIMVEDQVIFEWGDTKQVHTIHSIRKAMLNSIFGIAVQQGVIDTNETIKDLALDDIHGLTENEKNARIADLLRSRSGVYHPAAAVSEGMLRTMPERDSYKPGEHYYYNNWDFNVLGYILEEKMGKSIYQLYHEQIAEPLGMHHFDGSYSSIDVDKIEYEDGYEFPQESGFYQYEKSKSRYPAYHFRMSARDMALYGQLYLKKGNWNGEQIISEEWIKKSTLPHSIYNERFGLAYGMLWYVLARNENGSDNSFYHTGTGVHMLGVYPSSNMVFVHRVNTEKEYSFNGNDLLAMIDLVFKAKSLD